MTVADLIKQLQAMDPNKEVWHNSSEGGMCGPMSSNPFYNETACFVGNGEWITGREFKAFNLHTLLQSKDVVMLDGI